MALIGGVTLLKWVGMALLEEVFQRAGFEVSCAQDTAQCLSRVPFACMM